MPAPPVRRLIIQGLLAGVLIGVAAGMPSAHAQGVELVTLQATRVEGGLDLEFVARVNLPATVEDALMRGVPVYFVAQATLLRSRWYWRDERVARASRSWRLAFQPLIGAWRVSLGGLSQSYATLPEALAAVSRSGWRLAEANRLEVGENYTIEFGYRLDTSQLPGPMQFGLGGQGDWAVGVTRSLRVE